MKKVLILSSFLILATLAGLAQVALADNTGTYFKTNNLHSVTLPNGSVFSFKVHDYFRFVSRAILPDNTIIDGNPGDPPPPAGTRIKFQLPIDFYSGSTWNAQRADNSVNLTTRSVVWGNPAPPMKIYSTQISGNIYTIKGGLSSNFPSFEFIKSGSFYDCSFTSTPREQTCTYGGGGACATFRVPRTPTGYKYTIWSDYNGISKVEGSRNGSILEGWGSMTFSFNVDAGGSCDVFMKCSDGIDNDGDGKIDLLDPGCAGPADDDETDGGLPQCSDGVDNADPEDVLVDLADPGCVNASDDNETDGALPQCSNNGDDDGDGKIDFDGNGNPANIDPGCTDANDNSEDDDLGLPGGPIPPPVITGPIVGKPGIAYAFGAQSAAVGAVDTKYKYLFDWDDDGTYDSPTGYVAEGQAASNTFAWSSLGVKTFKVKTRDENGNESGWSAAHTITLSLDAVCPVATFWTGCPVSCGGGTETEVSVNADCSTISTGNTRPCNIQACDSNVIEVPPGK